MLYPRLEWQHDVASTVDISGNPCIAVGSDERLYYALTVKGDVDGVSTSTSTFSILLGCLDSSGAPQWIFQDSRLVTSMDDVQPVLALGTSGELYVVFVTYGAVPGASNGADTFSFCGNCGSAAAGREDIVVARIDNIQTSSPSVTWVTQDAYLNSCNRETAPRVLYDRFQERLLIAYMCTGATLCKVAIGSPNIVVASLTPAGGLSWAYQEELLNGRGQNRDPSIAVDASGGIYVAYAITAAVEGGGSLQGEQDVEIVKLVAAIEGCGLVIKRPWILSAGVTVNAGNHAFNSTPSIACDSTTGNVFLTFTTTGQVPGGTKSAADKDIVFASVTSNGQLRWIQQGPIYNEHTYRYRYIDHPQLILDCNNTALYVAAHAYDMQGYDMLIMFRLDKDTGATQWLYRQDISTIYRAYIPVANFEAPFAAEFNSGPLSSPWIAMCAGHLYAGITSFDISTAWLFAFRQQQPVEDMTAFQYMAESLTICEDPMVRMEAQVQVMTTVTTTVMFTYSVFDASGNEVDFTIPPATAGIYERIAALEFFVSAVRQTYVILDAEGNQVTVGNYVTPTEQIDALQRYLAIFMSTYGILDENGEPVSFDLPPVA